MGIIGFVILSEEHLLLENLLKTLDILVHNGEEIASLRYIEEFRA